MDKDGSNGRELEGILDLARKDVKTESYPMSIGELISMYENDEVVLRPVYQRYFRWTHEQKSKLIESILIGLPMPSFFMAQDENGRWEVVDGMQRLSTIFDFIGVLKVENKSHGNYERFEILAEGLFYLHGFGGKKWADFSHRIQLDVKRAKMQLTILLRETNADAKFELFQRLNSGGTSISGQELRNAIMAGDRPEMLSWFEGLAGEKYFVQSVKLSEKETESRYDVELVLRFMVFVSPAGSRLKEFKSVDVFLTHVLREFLKDQHFDFDYYGSIFSRTFSKIFSIRGEGALRVGGGKFPISFFEVVAFGIAQNIENLPSDHDLSKRIQNVSNTSKFVNASGGGKNANYRIPKLLELGKSFFAP